MTYKQIEASREVRLWIMQLIVPIATTAIAAGIAVPEVREAVVKKCKSVAGSITKKMKRKEKKMEEDILGNELRDNCIRMFNERTGEYWIRKIRP